MTILPLIPQRCTPNSTGRATGEETKKKTRCRDEEAFLRPSRDSFGLVKRPRPKIDRENFKIRRGITKRLKPNEYIGFPGQRRDEANPVGRSGGFRTAGPNFFPPVFLFPFIPILPSASARDIPVLFSFIISSQSRAALCCRYYARQHCLPAKEKAGFYKIFFFFLVFCSCSAGQGAERISCDRTEAKPDRR